MYSNKEVLGKTATVRRLKSSVTVMTARHPLARLVSAFRDKFADGCKLDKPQSKDHFMCFPVTPAPSCSGPRSLRPSTLVTPALHPGHSGPPPWSFRPTTPVNAAFYSSFIYL
ncbi:hypothetical protein Pmani_015835 [Petrolisthes manimaculis]|uniref:Sulfotransferase n=1 Tax=Petrolisthes manimaculis TaxID=1843537 RepID=A0AAE1PT40_9EUCA|nr:hypothetical protein Pmani_015835 [Petrolisthes manimaculis]